MTERDSGGREREREFCFLGCVILQVVSNTRKMCGMKLPKDGGLSQ